MWVTPYILYVHYVKSSLKSICCKLYKGAGGQVREGHIRGANKLSEPADALCLCGLFWLGRSLLEAGKAKQSLP